MDIKQQLEGLAGAARLTRNGITPLGLDVGEVEIIAKAAIDEISRLEADKARLANITRDFFKRLADANQHMIDELKDVLGLKGEGS